MSLSSSPVTPSHPRNFLADDHEDDDESQRSISLTSPPDSPRNSGTFNAISLHDDPFPSTPSKPHSFVVDSASSSTFVASPVLSRSSTLDKTIHSLPTTEIGIDNAYDEASPSPPPLPTYPPPSNDTDSIASFASGSSRKARPESLLMDPPTGPLVLGVALVDFNHLVSAFISNYVTVS